MLLAPSQNTRAGNKLLLVLNSEQRRKFEARLETVSLKAGRVLQLPKLPVMHAYFVQSGLVSAVAQHDKGKHAVQAWTTGAEGMVGLSVVLGAETSPHTRTVLVDGTALRMTSDELRRCMNNFPSLREALLRYAHAVLVQAAQTAACNARHSVAQRLARFLLLMHDRLDSADLCLTHDQISRMLGIRRASVTEAVHTFEQFGSIVGQRGNIRILDRSKLDSCSCCCYNLIRQQFERVLHGSSPGPTAVNDPALGLRSAPVWLPAPDPK